MTAKSYDVLIVGGGIMGSSIAYHLAHLDHTSGNSVQTHLHVSTFLSPTPGERGVEFSDNCG